MDKAIRNTTGKPITVDALHKKYQGRVEAQKEIKPSADMRKLDREYKKGKS